MHLLEFMPHGSCYLWQSNLIALNLFFNLSIAVAYFAIPFTWLAIVPKYDLQLSPEFQKIGGLFAGFICACGLGHVLNAIEIWVPIYWLHAAVDGLTAFVSLTTALMFAPLLRRGVDYVNSAQRDALTGLLRREAFDESISRRLQRAVIDNTPVALLLLDLDRFKLLNDTYGHQAGDDVLRAVGGIIRRSMRDGDACGRIGGEEIAIAITGADIDTAYRRAEEIRERIGNAWIKTNRGTVQATCSIGVAVFPTHLTQGALTTTASPATIAVYWSEIIATADDALYRAKAEGRNRVVVGSHQK